MIRMNKVIMQRIILAIIALSVLGFALACGGQNTGGGDSPTDAYKKLYAAVKSKNTESIKKIMTRKTLDFGIMASKKNNAPIEKIYENGFTATTFSETLPETRDERVNGDIGSVEVWNSKESRWEDLPFIKEDGSWKFAMGDLWANTFKSPGPGRDLLEKQAANAIANTVIPTAPNMNSNSVSVTNSVPAVPKTDKKTK